VIGLKANLNSMDNVFATSLAKLRRVGRMCAKRRWLALAVGSGVAAASGLLIHKAPDRYEASAKVYVDTQTVLKPLMASLTYQPDIDLQVKILARTLITRPNIEKLARRPELQFDTSTPVRLEKLVSRLMGDIKVVPAGSGNLFEITYREANPQRAQRLVEATVDLFVNTGVVSKRRDSVEAGQFIEEQIRGYERQLTEAENRLKEFRIRNFGVSGVSNQDYFSRVSAATEQVSKLRNELQAAERGRDSYRRELAQEDPQLPSAPLPTNSVVADLEARLGIQKNQLQDLLRRYTDAHPDVIGGRRMVEQFEAELATARESQSRVDAGGGKAPTNPVYQKLRMSLAQADAEVAALRSQLATQSLQLEGVRGLAGRVPQVEAEHAQLNRDYDIIRKAYDTMVARRESAALGVKLDASSQLAEFRVVEPPRVSPSAAFPSRLHWAALSLVAALVLGAATAVGREMMAPTLDNVASLRQISGRPVLGAVAALRTPLSLRAQRLSLLKFGAVFGLVLLAQMSWIGWVAIKPHLS
jgi:polysaccharide chain length determinant protein (PEP-CTERM system associated)